MDGSPTPLRPSNEPPTTQELDPIAVTDAAYRVAVALRLLRWTRRRLEKVLEGPHD